MTEIPEIIKIENKSHIAILDTSSISFMQILYAKGLKSEEILKDYDLILIPKWVLAEINDAAGRVNYVHELIEKGYPIFSINEEIYTDLTDNEEVNLYKIVLLLLCPLFVQLRIAKVKPLPCIKVRST